MCTNIFSTGSRQLLCSRYFCLPPTSSRRSARRFFPKTIQKWFSYRPTGTYDMSDPRSGTTAVTFCPIFNPPLLATRGSPCRARLADEYQKRHAGIYTCCHGQLFLKILHGVLFDASPLLLACAILPGFRHFPAIVSLLQQKHGA